MRNKFAHNPFYKLNKSEVSNLYSALDQEDKEVLQAAHEKNRKKHGLSQYKKLEPKSQFILIAVVIKNIALAIKNELSKTV